MKPEPAVGQVWRDPDRRYNGDARYVRIDRIEMREEVQIVLGLRRKIQVPIARVSSCTGSDPVFKPITRFIRCDRFGRFYRFIRDDT